MGAGGESTKGMKRVSICPTNLVSSKSNELKSLAKLKHKNSSKTLGYDDDVEKQEQQAGSRRTGGGKGKTVLFWVVGVLGVLMLLELMFAIAVLLGPMVGMMTEVKETLQIVTDNKAVIEAGFEILTPTEPAAASEEETNTNSSSSVFLQWCVSSPCMSSQTDLCSNVDTGLASARENGLPVLPFPKPFCDAVEVLSTNQCLCDADLGNRNITGDAAQIVQFSGMIEHMCGTTLIGPDQGACQ